MNTLSNAILAFCRDCRGTTAIEYALLATMIGTAIVAASNSQYGLGLNVGFSHLEQSMTKYTSF